MKLFSLVVLMELTALNAKAETIVKGDCGFSTSPTILSANEPAVEVCLTQTVSKDLACFIVPAKYLPLADGLNVTYQASWEKGSDTTIQYSNGVLNAKAISPQNMSTDFVKVEIAADLANPKKATASRKIGGVFGRSFSCDFSN